MKYIKKAVSLVLALVLLVNLLPAAMAKEEASLRAVVTFGENADADTLLQKLEAMEGVEVLYTYSELFSGAAVEAGSAALAKIAALSGVQAVAPTRSHSRPQVISDPLQVSNSLPLMGAEGLDYTGDGLVIAVLDSGFRLSHQAFNENGLMTAPSLAEEDVTGFAFLGGTRGTWISQRVPFSYDYSHRDGDVSTADEHGTHVAALAVGYAVDSEGDVVFRGAAPAAQLLAMKVFPDNIADGADDADVLKALEDASALGADVICLSLGVDNGFTSDNILDGVYCRAFQRLREEGILLCCAAGNSGASVSSKMEGYALPTGAYTDYATLSAPASYPGATGIAAADCLLYESAGYLEAAGTQIPFAAAISEYGGELPSLGALDGQTLDLVSVPGLGRREDFAGLDMTGKVALVARGGITFTEKVKNAADAGAAACIIRNNEPGEIIPTVSDDTPIPCALVTQEAGELLLSCGGITFHAGGYLKTNTTQPTIPPWSAWGGTTDLRISPALTAPGSSILSASVMGDDLYEQLSGTSMATPNAAGAFALVLEKLYDQGIEDKKEAADLAQALLESTAELILDEYGTPVSPRQQGAGLVNVSAALTTPMVITQPLLEPGDSRTGHFVLSFRVKNLTEEPLELTVETTILTDDWGLDEEGTAYSLLAPLDISDGVTVSGPGHITLPAGGSQSVNLQLTVSDDLREELDQIYPHGFYTEGYITLTDQNGHSVHATFLGFTGHWEEAPVIDQTDFRDYLNALHQEEDLPMAELGANLAYLTDYSFSYEGRYLLGENPFAPTDALEERFAIPTADSGAYFTGGSLFSIDLYTLRNAPHVIMLVYDETAGEIYCVDDTAYLPKAGADPYTGELVNTGWFWWDGTDAQGRPLPHGTRAQVAFFAWPESDRAAQQAYDAEALDPQRPHTYAALLTHSFQRLREWSFPVTVDRCAPSIQAEAVDDALRVTVTDSQFTAWVSIRDEAGQTLAEETFAAGKAGESHMIELPLAELGDSATISAADYATNLTGYTFSLRESAGHHCAMSLLLDVAPQAWYHQAVDALWDTGLMADDESEYFYPDASATRADVITLLHRLAGAPAGEEDLPFRDAKPSDWYYEALAWAYGQGLVSGYSPDFFGAFASVERQQLAVMLWRFAGSPEAAGDLSAFSDSGEAAEWAETALAWCVEEGILSGREGGTLAPRERATRAELAQIMMNYHNR